MTLGKTYPSPPHKELNGVFLDLRYLISVVVWNVYNFVFHTDLTEPEEGI